MNSRLKNFLSITTSASVLSSLMAIIVGLLAGFIVLLISNPPQALGAFGTILSGGLSDRKNMGQVLYTATPILMTGLSVGFASRTGLFNIGASGQFIAGAYCAVLVGVKCTFLPGPLLCLAALIAAFLAGALWGSVPGILKAYRNVNEVISCIMMNYIGTYLVNFLIERTVFDSLKNQSMRVAGNANMPKLGLDLLFCEGNNVSSANSGILLAIITAAAIYVLLEKTQFGFELKACGFNKDAARYAGVSEKRSVICSMVIAGAMAGLGGALLYLAGSGKGIDVLDVLPNEGFNGIPVALLALNNPIGVIFAALFIAYLNVGGFSMQLFNFPPQVIEIIISIIIYFSAFSLVLKGVITSIRGSGVVK
ncbi:MAG: ABC transporter permease [Clostridiales bacterium]|jgi:simple sugar transport system permease protein|nr:ABC transporter permease [Clostridiales bacterium]